MITIPDSLKKYFLSPNYHLTEDNTYYYKANKYLFDQMRCGVKQDIVSTPLEGKKHPHFFQVTDRTCEYAFSSSCWDGMKDDERARTIYLLMRKTMKDRFPNISEPKLHFIISQELSHINAEAMFYQKKRSSEQDFVFIKPEYLEKSKGITVVSLLTHELQHHNDFTNIDNKILPYFQEHYLPAVPDFMLTEHIMALNISGELYNYKTNKFDPITPELQEQILMLKHKTYPLTSSSTIRDFSQVKSQSDMVQLMEFQAYLNTPLERRAYLTGLECAESILTKSAEYGITPSHADTTRMEGIRKFVTSAEQNARQITALTGVPFAHICNLFQERFYLANKLVKTAKARERLNAINEEIASLASCFTPNTPSDTKSLTKSL